jgi:hypothetical protein
MTFLDLRILSMVTFIARMWICLILSTGGLQQGSVVLSSYQLWLGRNATSSTAARVRGADLPTSQEVCLNYFFTHINLGGTVGVGSLALADLNAAGGICSTYMRSDPQFPVS